MDIRRRTGLIVRRGNEYLVGTICYSTELRWSIYPHDAWFTRDRDAGKKVARLVGGELMLFNPIVNRMRAYREEGERPRSGTLSTTWKTRTGRIRQEAGT